MQDNGQTVKNLSASCGYVLAVFNYSSTCITLQPYASVGAVLQIRVNIFTYVLQ